MVGARRASILMRNDNISSRESAAAAAFEAIQGAGPRVSGSGAGSTAYSRVSGSGIGSPMPFSPGSGGDAGIVSENSAGLPSPMFSPNAPRAGSLPSSLHHSSHQHQHHPHHPPSGVAAAAGMMRSWDLLKENFRTASDPKMSKWSLPTPGSRRASVAHHSNSRDSGDLVKIPEGTASVGGKGRRGSGQHYGSGGTMGPVTTNRLGSYLQDSDDEEASEPPEAGKAPPSGLGLAVPSFARRTPALEGAANAAGLHGGTNETAPQRYRRRSVSMAGCMETGSSQDNEAHIQSPQSQSHGSPRGGMEESGRKGTHRAVSSDRTHVTGGGGGAGGSAGGHVGIALYGNVLRSPRASPPPAAGIAALHKSGFTAAEDQLSARRSHGYVEHKKYMTNFVRLLSHYPPDHPKPQCAP